MIILFLIEIIVIIGVILYYLVFDKEESLPPTRCFRCKYSYFSSQNKSYTCTKYIFPMKPFDYCSQGEEGKFIGF